MGFNHEQTKNLTEVRFNLKLITTTMHHSQHPSKVPQLVINGFSLIKITLILHCKS